MKQAKRANKGTGAVKKVTRGVIGRENHRRVGKESTLLLRKIKAKPYLVLEPVKSERSIYSKAIELARQKGEAADKDVAELLLESHKQGDRRATYALATWYIHGGFFPVDAKKAFRLLRQSSKAGIPEALFDLGHSFEIGFGTAKSPTKALAAYTEAAMRNDLSAATEVVRCVFWGIGTKRNKKLAYLIDDLVQSRLTFSK